LYTPRGKRFKPRKFWKLAKDLIADRKYEEPCRIRTAVGRAYYAAFLYTKNKLKALGYHFHDDHRVHREVIDKLMNTGNPDYTTIGSKLDKLFENRRIADYRMGKPINLGEGNFCVEVSREIIDSVELIRRIKQ